MEVVVLRLPLVYGPGVKGNLAKLLQLIRLRLPLPFASIDNQRSFIGLDNLIHLIGRCIDHPKAAGQLFFASDGRDLSTPQLLSLISAATGRPARLFHCPLSLLYFFGQITGLHAEISRFVESAKIDISHTQEMLAWFPPVSIEQGILRMVEG
jgi:nucleoside-diphosphate-sugar epimerase